MLAELLLALASISAPNSPPLQGVTQAVHTTDVVAAAIRSATRGATIRVAAGVYRGPTLVIDRPLTLVGEPGAILDGGGDRPLLEIRADSVLVRGLTFRNVGVSFVDDRAALRIVRSKDCAVLDNRFEATFFAIYLEEVDRCRVSDNRIAGDGVRETMAGNGVHVWNSRHIVITGNDIEGHRDGIYLEFARHAEVRDNRSADNLRYGIHFMFSDSCEYVGNSFVSNGAGVAVMYAREVLMERNRFERNQGSATYGLLLKDIRDSRLTGNTFIANTVGLHAEGSNRVLVDGNEFGQNGWAIRVMANAMDNAFTNNVFVGNTFDVTTNGRHSTSTFRRNYWDAYRGYDLDADGFGDVPFRPVRLFSLIVETHPPALALLRSVFVGILDAAERVLPILTPETLVDVEPRMRTR